MFQKRILMLVGCLVLTAGVVWGQGGTGQISGTVTDPNGAVVSGAAVKVINLGTNFTRETTTNGDGVFTVALLPAGSYSVEITSQGLAATRQRPRLI